MENEIKMAEKSEEELFKDYCKRIGVSFGNLYLREFDGTKKNIEFRHPTKAEIIGKSTFLCDEGTGNIHMMPDDFILAELCSYYIYERGKNISHYIEEIKDKEKCYQSKNINIEQVTFNRATKPDINRKDLFSYVRVICNNTKYDLVFNRFFFDENNKVNCILLCPQIEMYDKSLKGSEKRNNAKIKDYPNTSDDNQGNAVYYNFRVDIHSPSKDIAEAFLKFVIDTEKKKANSKD